MTWKWVSYGAFNPVLFLNLLKQYFKLSDSILIQMQRVTYHTQPKMKSTHPHWQRLAAVVNRLTQEAVVWEPGSDQELLKTHTTGELFTGNTENRNIPMIDSVPLLRVSAHTPRGTCRQTGRPWRSCKQWERLWGRRVACVSSGGGRARPHRGTAGRWVPRGPGSRPGAMGPSSCLHVRALCQGASRHHFYETVWSHFSTSKDFFVVVGILHKKKYHVLK